MKFTTSSCPNQPKMNDGFPNPLLVAVFFIHLPSAIPCLNHEGLFEKGRKTKRILFWGQVYPVFGSTHPYCYDISPLYPIKWLHKSHNCGCLKISAHVPEMYFPMGATTATRRTRPGSMPVVAPAALAAVQLAASLETCATRLPGNLYLTLGIHHQYGILYPLRGKCTHGKLDINVEICGIFVDGS